MYSRASYLRRRETINYMNKIRFLTREAIINKIKHKGLSDKHIEAIINYYAGFSNNPYILEELVLAGVLDEERGDKYK